jgi:hypothetical protein
MLGLRMSVKEALNKLVHCVVRQASPELRRRAHHERNQAVAVHSELFVSTQGRLVEGPDQRMSVKGCETIKAHGIKLEEVSMSQITLKGSCLCGAVRYEVSGDPHRFYHCHCSRCRKSSGTGHATNLMLANAQLVFTEGESLLKRYKVPEAERFARQFCSCCGSAVARAVSEIDAVVIPAGSLDSAAPIQLRRGYSGIRARTGRAMATRCHAMLNIRTEVKNLRWLPFSCRPLRSFTIRW